jgi:hypothetical protein
MTDMTQAPPGAPPQPAKPGQPIDIQPMVRAVEAKIPRELQQIYDRLVLSGMRIMFDKRSHAMMEQQISKPGPMPQKMAEGIVAVIYMLWTKSNKTMPPQLVVPLTTTLALKAFDFLQKSGNPEATAQVLGEGVDACVKLVMHKFGVTEQQMAKLEQIASQHQQQPGAAPAAAPAPAGGPQ